MKYWWLIIVVFLIFFTIWSEHGSQDALNRLCHNSTPAVEPGDSINVSIEKTIETVRKNHTLVGWRRSLLIGLIVAIPIIWVIKGQFPTGFIFLVVVGAVTIGAYFSTVWMEYNWWSGIDTKIEDGLLDLLTKEDLKARILKDDLKEKSIKAKKDIKKSKDD